MTFAPSFAYNSAIAFPIPEAAPVTMATLSCNFNFIPPILHFLNTHLNFHFIFTKKVIQVPPIDKFVNFMKLFTFSINSPFDTCLLIH